MSIIEIGGNEKILMDNAIKILKKKYQKQRGIRKKELLENQVVHMQDVTIEEVQKFLRQKDVEKG